MDDDWGYPYFRKPPLVAIVWERRLLRATCEAAEKGVDEFGKKVFPVARHRARTLTSEPKMFFPACQVRVVRFYVRCPAPPSSFPSFLLSFLPSSLLLLVVLLALEAK